MVNVPAIVLLLRKTSLTLDEIRQLDPEQFLEIVKEVDYQESIESYQTSHYVGSILAAIANSVPRKGNRTYKAEDFMRGSKPKKRDGEIIESEEMSELAARFNIALPAKEIREL